MGQTSLAAWAAAGKTTIALAEGTADDLPLRTLTRMARLIYPHDGLPDAVYAGIVGDLLADPTQRSLLRSGAASLGGFLDLGEAEQISLLRKIESDEFFNAMKTPLMWALYNTGELWALIGYPGPSFTFGGYVDRGFDDIDWLPTT